MRKSALILAAAALAAPAAAQTPVDVPRFDGVRVQGGGNVTVRHGAAQRVTFTATRPELVDIKVERGKLVVRPCRRSCSNQRLDVVVVTPSLGDAAIHGGGSIAIGRGVARRGDLSLAITGGGRIDAREAAARDVTVSVTGGGTVHTGAPEALTVAMNGGGSVLHCGKPGSRTVSINGGGTLRESCGR